MKPLFITIHHYQSLWIPLFMGKPPSFGSQELEMDCHVEASNHGRVWRPVETCGDVQHSNDVPWEDADFNGISQDFNGISMGFHRILLGF
jgi:hypothetical protein